MVLVGIRQCGTSVIGFRLELYTCQDNGTHIQATIQEKDEVENLIFCHDRSKAEKGLGLQLKTVKAVSVKNIQGKGVKQHSRLFRYRDRGLS